MVKKPLAALRQHRPGRAPRPTNQPKCRCRCLHIATLFGDIRWTPFRRWSMQKTACASEFAAIGFSGGVVLGASRVSVSLAHHIDPCSDRTKEKMPQRVIVTVTLWVAVTDICSCGRRSPSLTSPVCRRRVHGASCSSNAGFVMPADIVVHRAEQFARDRGIMRTRPRRRFALTNHSPHVPIGSNSPLGTRRGS